MFHVSKYFSNLIDKLSDSAKIKKKCTTLMKIYLLKNVALL